MRGSISIPIDYKPAVTARLTDAINTIIDAMEDQGINSHTSHAEVDSDAGPASLAVICCAHRSEEEFRAMMRVLTNNYCKLHYPPTVPTR